MKNLDRLQNALEKEYRKKTHQSLRLYRRAEKVMIRGGSHSLRLWQPYPFFVSQAKGSRLKDVDGNSYIDYWQGHYANILGHNPEVVEREIRSLASRGGLHTGFEDEAQVDLAETLLGRLGYKDYKIRFTTSGTLATMYAVMLAKGFTGRDEVLKVGGGWHGGSPFLLKGVHFREGTGFRGAESAGLTSDIIKKTRITTFNDPSDLIRILRRRGDKIACFILEPFMGVGGFIAASREYLETVRNLTAKYGIVLIFDEIISGFRFCPSGVQSLYGIKPDLTAFGKLIGGGQAVAAVAGKAGIMEGCERKTRGRMRVLFEGGTFSAHTEYMRAGQAMLSHLIRNAGVVYPRLGELGDRLRLGIEKAFAAEGIQAKCTGGGNDVVRRSSLFMVNFPLRDLEYQRPEDSLDDRNSNLRLREVGLKLALLLNGVHVVHGGGAVSLAHSDGDIRRTIAAYSEAARLFRKFLY